MTQNPNATQINHRCSPEKKTMPIKAAEENSMSLRAFVLLSVREYRDQEAVPAASDTRTHGDDFKDIFAELRTIQAGMRFLSILADEQMRKNGQEEECARILEQGLDIEGRADIADANAGEQESVAVAAHRLGHSGNSDNMNLMPLIVGVDNLLEDDWYVLTIDTAKEGKPNTNAAIMRFSSIPSSNTHTNTHTISLTGAATGQASTNASSVDFASVPDTPILTSIFFLLDGVSDKDAFFIDRNKLFISDHAPHTTLGTPADNKWHFLSYNPVTDRLTVTPLGDDGRGQSGTDQAQLLSRSGGKTILQSPLAIVFLVLVWLLSHLAGKVTTVSEADEVDICYIDSNFLGEVFSGKTTHVIVDNSCEDVLRYSLDVAISTALAIGKSVQNSSNGNSDDRENLAGDLVAGAAFLESLFFGLTPSFAISRGEAPPNFDGRVSSVPITFTEGENPDKSVAIDYTDNAMDTMASGVLTIAATGDRSITSVTHTGADATYGTFTYNTETGAWEYELDPTDRDTLRLRSQSLTEAVTFTDTITFTATDSTGNTSTHQLIIDIEVTGEADRDLDVRDFLSSRQATVIIHGVLFTVNDPGIGGNDIRIDFARGSSTAITSSGGDYTITLAEDATVTPEYLKDLWDDDSTRSTAITAMIIDPDIPDATIDQIAGRYIFRGGANEPDPPNQGKDDKETTLDWGTPTNNDLEASGRLSIIDTDDGLNGSTVEVVSSGRYGEFNIPMRAMGTHGNAIFDWTYTLDPTDTDTHCLTGGGDDGSTAEAFYDIITLKVEDRNGGISFYDIPITITVTGTMPNDRDLITFMESDDSDKSVAINHGATTNKVTDGNADGTLTAALKCDSGVTLEPPTHNGDDAIYGTFKYTESTGKWTYTPDEDDRDTLRLRSQSLTEAVTFTETITFTATDSAGNTRTHDLIINIAVTGEADRDLMVRDFLSSRQATVIIHGVLFTVNDPGIGGNNIHIDVVRGSSTAITSSDGDYTITLAEDATVTPEYLKDLWDADSTRSTAITAMIIDPDIPDATRDQIAGRYIFRGGANEPDRPNQGEDDKETTLDWGTPTNNDLEASGWLIIIDTDDGLNGSTVEVVSSGRYGEFNIPMRAMGTPGNAIFGWTYTLDPIDTDTRELTGGGDDGSTAEAFYDIITIKIEDRDGGISFHDIPIVIKVTGELREVSFTHRHGQFRHNP